MKVSLNWVKQYTQSKLSNQQLIKLIGARLAEVDSVLELGPAYDGIVLAEIVAADFHPNADKLGVYKVRIGRVTRQVVAGDRSLQLGDRVAYIPPGKIVPSQFFSDDPEPIRAVKLRGIQSNGMLASAKELMFGDDHEGVLKLDTTKPIGSSLADCYELDDIILDIENKALTHRPDCFGVIGFAREVSAIQGLAFHSPKWLLKESRTFGLARRKKLKLAVVNSITDKVPTYLAVALTNVSVRPSPVQLRSYLARVGVRPINNVVDVTNYLMIASGQPLHAFDYDKVKGRKLVVKHSPREKLELIDGRLVRPDAKAVLVCDSEGALALGGIMGGSASEVSDSTKNIIIESATFTPESVRKTSLSLGVQSEAVTRFARGQSSSLPRPVLLEAVQMLEEIVGAKQASGVVGNNAKHQGHEIMVSADAVNVLLGTSILPKQISAGLARLEVGVKERGNSLKVIPPFWRKDLNIWQDVAEDIGRLSGFDSVKPTIKPRDLKPVRRAESVEFSRRIRNILVSAGANEVLTYSAVAQKVVEQLDWDEDRLYKIKNARSPQLKFMRPSLLPSLLEKVHPAHKQGYDRFVLFEIGAVHDKDKVHRGLPDEQLRLALVFSNQKLHKTPAYYWAKYWADYLFQSLGVAGVNYERMADKKSAGSFMGKAYDLERAGKLKIGRQSLGYVGEFKDSHIAKFKLPEGSAGFEIDLNELAKFVHAENSYQALHRFPEVQRDLTYEVDKSIAFSDIKRDIEVWLGSQSQVSYSLTALDIYEPNAKQKRLSFNLMLWHGDQTLSSNEASKIVDQLGKHLSKQHKAKQI